MLAEVLAPAQLALPPPVGDIAMLRVVPPPPESQVVAVNPQRAAVAHPRRHRSLAQLWLIQPPPDPGKPKIGGVVRSLAQALADYRVDQKKKRKRRRAKTEAKPATTPPRKARQRSRATRPSAPPPKAPVVVEQAPVVALAGCDVTAWDWSEEADAGRLVDGGTGPEGWAAWRGSVVEDAMLRRAAVVKAELEAKGAPTGPRQVRTKQQAQAAATAVLMAGKPGKAKQKTAPPGAEGAKA